MTRSSPVQSPRSSRPAAQPRQRLAKRTMSSNFSLSRRLRQPSWYRYCLRPAASVPVAWRWPRGSGQIQTSFHAGGMRELGDPGERLGLVDALAVVVEVGEAAPAPDAADPGTRAIGTS